MALGAKVAAIEFAEREVRVAVVRTGGAQPVVLELHACMVEMLPDTDPIEARARALDYCLDQIRQHPAAYVFCANSAFSIVRTLTIPFRGRRRVASAVQFELEPYLAFPIEELLVDFNVVAEVEGQTEVLAMGMQRANLEEQLAVLGTVGIEADAVNLDVAAMTGLWQSTQKNLKGLNAVLHLRENGAALAVTWNKTLAYFRALAVSPDQLLNNPNAAAREIQNTLRAFLSKWRGGGEITQLNITGVDLTPDQNDALSQALRMPVESMILITRLKGGDQAMESKFGAAAYNIWEPAIGAALGAGGGGFSLDFKKSERDWQSAARGVITHVMFSSCLALLVLLGWGYFYYQGTAKNMAEAAGMQAQIDGINKEIEAMDAKMFPKEVQVDSFGDPSLLDILAEISARMPEDKVSIVDIKLGPPGAKGAWLTIDGTAKDAAQFNEVYKNLQSSTLFKVLPDPDIRLQGAVTTFRVRAKRLQEDASDTPEA